MKKALLSLFALFGIFFTPAFAADQSRADVAYTTDLTTMKKDIATNKYRITLLEKAGFVDKSVTNVVSARVDVADGEIVILSEQIKDFIVADDATNIVLGVVPAWARAETKPTYDYTEIENAPDVHGVITAQEATNIVNGVVPAWARAQEKPTYDYSEVQNTPDLSNFVTEAVTNGLASQAFVTEKGTEWLESVAEWAADEGFVTETVTNGLASTAWVNAQNFVDKSVTNGLASKEYVDGRGFVDETVTNGLASVVWVNAQGFVDESVTNGLASKGWVNEQGFVDESVTNGLASQAWVDAKGFVDETVTNGLASSAWVSAQGFVTETITNGLASQSWANGKFATSSWAEGITDYIMDHKHQYITTDDGSVGGGETRVVVENGVAKVKYIGAVLPGGDGPPVQDTWEKTVATTDQIANFVDKSVTNGLASVAWVNGQGFVTESVTNGLASTAFVTSQGFVTETVTNGLASTSWVNAQGFVDESVTNGLASTTWVGQQGFVTESVTNGLASTSYVNTKLEDYVEETALTTAIEAVIAKAMTTGIIVNGTNYVLVAERVH